MEWRYAIIWNGSGQLEKVADIRAIMTTHGYDQGVRSNIGDL